MKRIKLILLSALACFNGGLRAPFATANAETAAGTHKIFGRRADAQFAHTHLLVKAGSDDFHATFAGAGDYPIGSTTDSPFAAEDSFNVHPLGSSEHTRRLRCATALTNEIDLYTAANGFVQAEPTVAGVYYKVGRSVALAVQELSGVYTIEVAPCAPVKLTVIAAATGTAATDIAAIFTALGTPTLLKHA
jgi:hypothetical protein